MRVKVIYSTRTEKSYELRLSQSHPGEASSFSCSMSLAVPKDAFREQPQVGDEFNVGLSLYGDDRVLTSQERLDSAGYALSRAQTEYDVATRVRDDEVEAARRARVEAEERAKQAEADALLAAEAAAKIPAPVELTLAQQAKLLSMLEGAPVGSPTPGPMMSEEAAKAALTRPEPE